MQELLSILRRLRGPNGCPWDRQQTHSSLRGFLIEEAYEAIDAILDGDEDAIVEELGDVLLQIAFHVVIGEEERTFGYPEIEKAIVEKLVRRHPHVFGDVKVNGINEVDAIWESIKKEEHGPNETKHEVPNSLPALKRAVEACKLSKSEESLVDEKLMKDYQGDPQCVAGYLWSIVCLAVRNGIDPELELRDLVNRKLGQL